MISFFEAQNSIRILCEDWLKDQPPTAERVPLIEGLGRYLTEDLVAPLDLPLSDVSAMDGYALCAQENDLPITVSQRYTVIGESRAGLPYAGRPLAPGECIRIFTGAVVPQSSSTVVIQENVSSVEPDLIEIQASADVGSNIRRQGEEICKGAYLARAGGQMTPNKVPLLASQGLADVTVRRRLRVAIFATGDELKKPGEALGAGDIFESNRVSIHAVLHRYPVELIDLGVIEDTPEAIAACLRAAALAADLVISSGGVSVGDYDFVRSCVESMGALTHYKVAMKPGKPVCFGHLDRRDGGRALFFGLPGNAVSSFVVMTELYLPVIQLLISGDDFEYPAQQLAIVDADIERRPGRLEFQRGVLRREVPDSSPPQWRVSAFSSQDSHRVLGLAQANCTIRIPADVAHIRAGTEVVVSVFPWCDGV
jgi:molybdopterin molybdotransferase